MYFRKEKQRRDVFGINFSNKLDLNCHMIHPSSDFNTLKTTLRNDIHYKK